MENNDKQNFIHTALYKGECESILKQIPDKSVDLVIIDPPYEFDNGGGGGAFGPNRRNYHKEYISLYKETGTTKNTEKLRICANADKLRNNIKSLSKGFDFTILDELIRIMKKINIYIYGVVRHK